MRFKPCGFDLAHVCSLIAPRRLPSYQSTETLLSWGCPMSDSKKIPNYASTSEAITNNVRVEVESQYAPEHSQPFQNNWRFYYTIRITNEGDETVQLLSRHW